MTIVAMEGGVQVAAALAGCLRQFRDFWNEIRARDSTFANALCKSRKGSLAYIRFLLGPRPEGFTAMDATHVKGHILERLSDNNGQLARIGMLAPGLLEDLLVDAVEEMDHPLILELFTMIQISREIIMRFQGEFDFPDITDELAERVLDALCCSADSGDAVLTYNVGRALLDASPKIARKVFDDEGYLVDAIQCENVGIVDLFAQYRYNAYGGPAERTVRVLKLAVLSGNAGIYRSIAIEGEYRELLDDLEGAKEFLRQE